MGIENMILKLLMLRSTSIGNFLCNWVEIAQIQPKIPMINTSIITGNNFTIIAGREKVYMFMVMGTPHVIRNNCQCFSLSKNFMVLLSVIRRRMEKPSRFISLDQIHQPYPNRHSCGSSRIPAGCGKICLMIFRKQYTIVSMNNPASLIKIDASTGILNDNGRLMSVAQTVW
jgi:hypothetical protein